MTKRTPEEEVEEYKRLSREFGKDLGEICDDAANAVENAVYGPELQALIDIGREKVRQYKRVLARLAELGNEKWVAGFKNDYKENLGDLRESLETLEEMTKRTPEQVHAHKEFAKQEAKRDEETRLRSEFGNGLGKISNDTFDAIKRTGPGPALQAIIDKGWEKVRQYDRALARLTELGNERWVASFKEDYEWRADRLRANLAKLEAKQKGAALPTANNGHGKAKGD